MYPLANAAVAFGHELFVGAVFQRPLDLDRGRHGAAVAAAVVGLGVLEAGRVGFRTRVSGHNILGVPAAAVEPGDLLSVSQLMA